MDAIVKSPARTIAEGKRLAKEIDETLLCSHTNGVQFRCCFWAKMIAAGFQVNVWAS